MKRKASLMAMALLLTMALGSVAAFAAGTSISTPYVGASYVSNPESGLWVTSTSSSTNGGTLYGSYSSTSNGNMLCQAVVRYSGSTPASFTIYPSGSKSTSFQIVVTYEYKAYGKINGTSTSDGTVKVTVA